MIDPYDELMCRRPLKPCRKCGDEVEAKWICAYGKQLAKVAHHPFDGRAGWYVTCQCGTMFVPLGNYADAEHQKRALRKLEREWNKRQEEPDA